MADNHAQGKGEEKAENEDIDAANRPQNRSVCRRLDFGKEVVNGIADVSELLCLSTEELLLERQKAIEKWNFDFENEIPLDGDWEWEKVPVQPKENKEVVTNMEKKHAENRTV